MHATVTDAALAATPRIATVAPPGASTEDRCPGALRPHDAHDGLLLRVRLVGGRLGRDALLALAAASARGNGIVEVTSRGNVQVRGLGPADLRPVTDLLAGAGLLPSPAHDRVRGVLADPLAGRRQRAVAGPTEVDAVLDGLDAGVCADPRLVGLSGRFLVAVDDGTGTTDDHAADLRLCAAGAGRWAVEVDGRRAGDPMGLEIAVAFAVGVAGAFVAAPAPEASRRWRIADLPGGAADVVPVGTTLGPRRPPARPPGTPSVGTIAQADGRHAVGALAPLGRIAADALTALAGLAEDRPVRVGAGRTVAVLDLDAARAPAVARALDAVDLLTDPGSGWAGLTACAGEGACRRALADVRARARARAAERSRTGVRSREHWSACARRCGDGPGVARSVTARADGGWDVDARGEAGR